MLQWSSSTVSYYSSLFTFLWVWHRFKRAHGNRMNYSNSDVSSAIWAFSFLHCPSNAEMLRWLSPSNLFLLHPLLRCLEVLFTVLKWRTRKLMSMVKIMLWCYWLLLRKLLWGNCFTPFFVSSGSQLANSWGNVDWVLRAFLIFPVSFEQKKL